MKGVSATNLFFYDGKVLTAAPIPAGRQAGAAEIHASPAKAAIACMMP